MSYKTILVNAQPAPRAQQIVAYASRLTTTQDAHLVGLATSGLSELAYQCNGFAPGAPMVPEDLQALNTAARQALGRFSSTAGRLGVVSSEERLTDDSLLDALVQQARYADLVVVGQANAGAGPLAPQQLIVHCHRPVVVVPDEGDFYRTGERLLLAWDGGMAASRAVEAALPLLRRASLTSVAIFNPGACYGAHGQEPGADLARYLVRHGVKVELVVRDTGRDVGDALLTLAAESGADLLVMGCYGHTRFREILLGGVSRSVLASMTLPVLMAH